MIKDIISSAGEEDGDRHGAGDGHEQAHEPVG